MLKKIFFVATLCFAILSNISAQLPTEKFVKVMISPDHDDWTYKIGEKVKFTIAVLKNGNLVNNARIRYEIGPEKLDPTQKDTLQLSTGKQIIEAGTMNTSGFLRCTAVAEIDGKEYRNLCTVGFEPLKISPTVGCPSDFDAFWNSAKTELSKIPIDAKMTLMPERCTEKVNVYHVNIQNFRAGARLYGILCVPKKEGKYPVLLQVPGAGVRPYLGNIGDAEKGVITLQIGIHGVPVNMDAAVYADLGAGALNNYQSFNLDDKNRFYYKRVYMGCIRAIDFLTNLPQYDGSNLAILGYSQGGALSIITAALDNRVKYLGVVHPALADVTGYLNGRAGGWPHYFDKFNRSVNETKEKLATIPYYDVVNFAQRVKIPGFYTWGYNDDVCPPTSMYAAYNVITAPKELFLALDTGHWVYPEQSEKITNWLIEKLKGKN